MGGLRSFQIKVTEEEKRLSSRNYRPRCFRRRLIQCEGAGLASP
jgi:hypothetical protein